VIAPSTTASTTSARRQPNASMSAFSNGRKIVEANPATSVTAVSAWRRRSTNHFVTTTKAGSYSTVAITTPSAAHSRTNSPRCRTWDQASTPTVAATEPSVISTRGLCRSSQRPTNTAAAPWVSSATENAAVMEPRDQFRSSDMGRRNTVNP
jgi:hypothetical protein